MQHSGVAIKLGMDQIEEFVSICTKQDAEIDVFQKEATIDGKSYMGIYSLNLAEPILVEIYTDNKTTKTAFYRSIDKWSV